MAKAYHRVYLLLGSNIHPRQNIPLAITELNQSLEIQKISTTWETPPVGSPGPNFYNTAVYAHTLHSIQELTLSVLRPIEARMGRVRTSNKYAPRTIDLDVILYDDQLLEPRLWSLAFIAVPMAEIYPLYLHPCSGLTLADAAEKFMKSYDLKPRPEVIIEMDKKPGRK